MKNSIKTICIFASMLILSLAAFGQTESSETTKLSMVSDSNKVLIKVENGEITNVTVNGKDVPKDRVRLVGKGLEVVNEKREIVGAMANLSANGKSPLHQKKQREPILTYNDNSELKIEIKDSRFLVVTLNGKMIPPNQIKFEEDALKIYNENGDVIRVIRADSPKE
jgi:hypothetical protein